MAILARSAPYHTIAVLCRKTLLGYLQDDAPGFCEEGPSHLDIFRMSSHFWMMPGYLGSRS